MPSNLPGTCLWCGKRLQRLTHAETGYGVRGDEFFYTKSCGYNFGVAAARHGFRVEVGEPGHGPVLEV